MTISLILFPLILLIVLIEISNKLKAASPLIIKPKTSDVKREEGRLEISGYLEIENTHNTIEVMIPSFSIKPTLLGKTSLKNLKIYTSIIPNHPDQEKREDNYWPVYILKSTSSTFVQYTIVIESMDGNFNKKIIESVWLNINWLNYGPFGILKRKDGFSIPISQPQIVNQEQWIDTCKFAKLLPIKTHILGKLDDPFNVLYKYASTISRPGDILTIGETPLAIMQGRYLFPSTIQITFLSRLLCMSFHPTSSLATACGMQSLIDLQGPSRVLIAWLIGSMFKIVGIKGMFYRLAGEQARLIDDITGTTPPYDQTIVLGPLKTKDFCNISAAKLGIDVAVVDVNDLGKVKVLSCSDNCNKQLLKESLMTNPAGNANQHTPLVLIRPSSRSERSLKS